MKSSPPKTKPTLEQIVKPMSGAQKLFKLLRKLGIKNLYQHGDNHLRELRKFAERVYRPPN